MVFRGFRIAKQLKMRILACELWMVRSDLFIFSLKFIITFYPKMAVFTKHVL